MSGESRAFGAGPTVFFDGRTVPVRPRDNFFDGFVEAECVKARGNPLDVLIQAARMVNREDGEMDERRMVLLVSSVMQESKSWRNCTDFEKRVFLQTPLGEALTLWYCLKHEFGPDWTIDRVRYVMGESLRAALRMGEEAAAAWVNWKEGLFAAIDQAGGEDLLGNLTGLRLLRTEAQGQVPGKSSECSPKNSESTPSAPDA